MLALCQLITGGLAYIHRGHFYSRIVLITSSLLVLKSLHINSLASDQLTRKFDWVVKTPNHWKYKSSNSSLTPSPNNASFIEKADFIRGLNPRSKRFMATDFEAFWAIEKYFWGLTG